MKKLLAVVNTNPNTHMSGTHKDLTILSRPNSVDELAIYQTDKLEQAKEDRKQLRMESGNEDIEIKKLTVEDVGTKNKSEGINDAEYLESMLRNADNKKSTLIRKYVKDKEYHYELRQKTVGRVLERIDEMKPHITEAGVWQIIDEESSKSEKKGNTPKQVF